MSKAKRKPPFTDAERETARAESVELYKQQKLSWSRYRRCVAALDQRTRRGDAEFLAIVDPLVHPRDSERGDHEDDMSIVEDVTWYADSMFLPGFSAEHLYSKGEKRLLVQLRRGRKALISSGADDEALKRFDKRAASRLLPYRSDESKRQEAEHEALLERYGKG